MTCLPVAVHMSVFEPVAIVLVDYTAKDKPKVI